MVNLLIGTKGTGKTKRLISKANLAVENSKGYVAVVASGMELRYDINARARLIDVNEYGITGSEMLLGFLSGICAGNYDVTDILVDTTLKILGNDDMNAFSQFADNLVKLSEQSNTNIVLSVSADEKDIPDSVKKIAKVE